VVFVVLAAVSTGVKVKRLTIECLVQIVDE